MEKCVKESEVVAVSERNFLNFECVTFFKYLFVQFLHFLQMQYASPADQSPTDEIVQDASTRRKLSFAEEADP